MNTKKPPMFIILFCVVVNTVFAAQLDFGRDPLCAGKQLLAEDAYYIKSVLGVSRFTPSTAIPLKIVYKSNSKTVGIFGKKWSAPLLESSLQGDIWVSPWGEIIKLPDANKRFEKIDRMICGINEYAGWEFLYLFGKLQKIITPEKLSIDFIYNGPDQKISAIECRGVAFIAFTYQSDTVKSIFNSSVIYNLTYKDNYLSKISVSNLHPTEFKYTGDKLTTIIRGSFRDDIKLDNQGRIVSDCLYKYQHDASGILLSSPSGVKTLYSYNGNQLRISTNNYIRKTYDLKPAFDKNYLGLITKIKTGEKVEAFKYDNKYCRLIEYTDPFQNKVINELDDRGLVCKTFYHEHGTTPRLMRTMEYDRFLRLSAGASCDLQGNPQSKVKYQYTQEGLLREITADRQHFLFSYNPFGFIESLSAGPDKTIMWQDYNDFNRVTSSISDFLYTYDYNYSGLPSEMVAVDGDDKEHKHSKMYYDLYGNLTLTRDINGREYKIQRTPWGAPQIVTNANGGITRYEYDNARNLIKVIDPNGNEIRFVYGIWGIKQIITEENQITEYEYDNKGRTISQKNYFKSQPGYDRLIKYHYDNYDRQVKIDYGNGYIKEFTFYPQGYVKSVKAITPDSTVLSEKEYKCGLPVKETVTIKKTGNSPKKIVRLQEFNALGQRTSLVIKGSDIDLRYDFSYDSERRLAEISSGEHNVRYEYSGSKVIKQIVDNIEIVYTYDIYGRLTEKKTDSLYLKYFYTVDGKVAAREFCGEKHFYTYDKLDQLICVKDKNNKIIEKYVYDPAGNILNVICGDERLSFTYDKANQIKYKKSGRKTYKYQYDAAGRLLADEMYKYRYGWMNSVVSANDIQYLYDTNEQLAIAGDKDYLWDGLALIVAGKDKYLFEPSVAGGSPLLINSEFAFTDMLGSTLAVSKQKGMRTSFGRSTFEQKYDFFTGKPMVAGLGHNFLLRNYNSHNARWNGADPLGYPDGWNNQIYCINNPSNLCDNTGGSITAAAVAFIGFGLKLYAGYQVTETVTEKIIMPSVLDLANGTNTADLSVLSAMPSLALTAASGYTGDIVSKGGVNFINKPAWEMVKKLHLPTKMTSDVRSIIFDTAGIAFDLTTAPLFQYAENSVTGSEFHKTKKLAEQRKEDNLNSIEVDADIKSIRVSVWDYAAEDGDRVRVQHFINGKLVAQTGEITIMHAPKTITVNGITDGSQVRVWGTYDGGGGITYAANIGGRSLTNRTQTAAANRYKIKRRPNGKSGPQGYAQ